MQIAWKLIQILNLDPDPDCDERLITQFMGDPKFQTPNFIQNRAQLFGVYWKKKKGANNLDPKPESERQNQFILGSDARLKADFMHLCVALFELPYGGEHTHTSNS